MESFFTRFKNALVLIAILLAQTIALATQVQRAPDPLRPDGHHVRLIRLWSLALVSPFERLSTGGGHGLRSAWSNYIGLRHVRQQNQELERQIAQLRLERAALSEDALEAQRLRALLDFKQQYVATTVVAQVIGTSGSDQSRLLILNKGARDGLKPDMPVITPDGIVGKLRDVFPSTAQLLLIDDPSSGAGVLLQSTRIRGILRGSAQGRILINNLTADARIKPGETVLTSGGDQVFPRGLPVGVIESITPDPEHQPYTAILIKPAANLNRLEEVLIITGTGGALDSQAQQSLTADAASRAADRLPTVTPDAATEAGGVTDAPPPSENSSGLVPKPKPVLHPDRYTPNATLPADSLTPGKPN